MLTCYRRWVGWGLLGLLGSVVCLRAEAWGQAGVSSASVGMTRSGMMLQSSQFRVEEFVNYHRHDLPQPEAGRAVALSTSWGRAENGNLIFQVGLATASQSQSKLTIRPLNLVLVIDCSGSMSGDRIDNVQRGIRSFVERLRAEDKVTIVTYESTARVALEAACKAETHKIDRVIRELRAGGATNLHAGLMLGYREAERHFDAQRTNRVILLTDGIANTGVVAAAAIAADSKKFNDKNIDLSTIGLGSDLDQELLRGLADAGRGLLHFIGDDQDLSKVFVQEIDSLLSSAARDVRVDIRVDSDLGTVRFFGYQPELAKNKHRFRLDDLNHDATQVIVGEIVNSAEVNAGQISVKLTYVDELSGKENSEKQTVDFGDRKSKRKQPSDLQKNYQIATLAMGLREFAELVEQGESGKARRYLERLIQDSEQTELKSDADVERILAICHGYLDECVAWHAESTGRANR
ncbi:MAG: VWA domain-containing protein [Planctomycetaceae bacterium]|nr:VWA domain-containing protein [Planctomycetaceae bacterium]